MNTLDDLRSTLDQHAGDLVDRAVPDRVTSVRGRVHVVRRRRRAAAVGGLAAVVAVAGGLALLPGGPDDAAPEPAGRVFGIDVPATMQSTGYTYALSDTILGDWRAVADGLDRSDEPHLVSWATSGSDQRVTVEGYGDQDLHLADADFANWLLLPAGVGEHLVVTAEDGDVALAVYALGSERPSGYTKDGVTFRQDVAGGELAGAVVGDPGETTVSLPVSFSGDEAWVHVECTGAPRRTRYDVLRDGEDFLSGGRCDDSLPVDMSGLSGYGFETVPGDSAVLEARLHLPVGADPSTAQVALGAYSELAHHDGPFGAVVEAEGHVWRLADTRGTAGAASSEVSAPDAVGPVYAAYASRGVGGSVSFPGRGGRTYLVADSGSARLLDPGQVLHLQVDGPDPSRGQVLVGFYTRAD